jgi:HPt (histidine-containing phosphotransfer) domain-containing protein
VTVNDKDAAEAEFQAQMAALCEAFVRGLPARHAALAAAWRDCADDANEPAWARLREVAHKLSGSASNYGFEALGTAARELDKLLSGHVHCRVRGQAEPAVSRLRDALDGVIASA